MRDLGHRETRWAGTARPQVNQVRRTLLIFKMFNYKFIIGVAVVFSVLGGGFLWLRYNSTLFNVFFSPKDFYEPLAKELLFDRAKEYSFEVKHNYPGLYAVEVVAPSSNGIGVPYEMDFAVEIVLKSEGKKILHQKISEPYSQFWRSEGGGIILLYYSVPELVPKSKSVQIMASVSGNINKFIENYGESNLVVAKNSDK